MLKVLWSVRWHFAIVVIVLIVGVATETQEVEPLFKLEWNQVQGWHYPDRWQAYPDTVTVIACETDRYIVLTSPWWADVKIAKLLVWHGDIPDWRNVGDGNPHPPEYWVIDYRDVEGLCE